MPAAHAAVVAALSQALCQSPALKAMAPVMAIEHRLAISKMSQESLKHEQDIMAAKYRADVEPLVTPWVQKAAVPKADWRALKAPNAYLEVEQVARQVATHVVETCAEQAPGEGVDQLVWTVRVVIRLQP